MKMVHKICFQNYKRVLTFKIYSDGDRPKLFVDTKFSLDILNSLI